MERRKPLPMIFDDFYDFLENGNGVDNAIF